MNAVSDSVRAPVRVGDLAAFVLVGSAACAVHFAVVMVSVPFGVPPLVANVLAFATAFAVSFCGHARWSFPAQGRPVAPALRRFAAVAVGGFLINEAAYACLLAWTALDYRVALALVLAGVAGLTWAAGRYWAFAHG